MEEEPTGTTSKPSRALVIFWSFFLSTKLNFSLFLSGEVTVELLEVGSGRGRGQGDAISSKDTGTDHFSVTKSGEPWNWGWKDVLSLQLKF